MEDILNDTSKLMKITRDPTEALMTTINKIIEKNNFTNKAVKFEKLIGDFARLFHRSLHPPTR